MALPLWGQLQKAQDDPETIEEAIERVVSEHNAEPEAHLGEGQSLESHKTEPIIDHPQGSVLADKRSTTELILQFLLNAGEGWDFDNASPFVGVSGASILNNGTIFLENNFYAEAGLAGVPILQRDKTFIFQFMGLASLDFNDVSYHFGVADDPHTPSVYLRLIMEGGDTILELRTTANVTHESTSTIDISEPHIYRIFYDADIEQIQLLVDGNVELTIAVPVTGLFNCDFYVFNGEWIGGMGTAQFTIQNLYVSTQV